MFMVFLLALCVSGGTTAYSQINITSAQARCMIARLDTLNYLRAGNAQLEEMVKNLETQCYQKDTIIFLQDSVVTLQTRLARESNERLQSSMKSEYKYRGMALGLGSTTLLATAAAILIAILR